MFFNLCLCTIYPEYVHLHICSVSTCICMMSSASCWHSSWSRLQPNDLIVIVQVQLICAQSVTLRLDFCCCSLVESGNKPSKWMCSVTFLYKQELKVAQGPVRGHETASFLFSLSPLSLPLSLFLFFLNVKWTSCRVLCKCKLRGQNRSLKVWWHKRFYQYRND